MSNEIIISPPGQTPARFALDERCATAFGNLLLALESTNSQRAYRQDWHRYCRWCESEEIDPLTATAPVIQRYLQHMRENRLAKSTRARSLSVIREVYRALVTGGLCPINPAREVKNPAVDQMPSTPWTDRAGAAALFRAARGNSDNDGWRLRRDRLILMSLFLLGWRRAEVARIRVEDVDGQTITQVVKRGKSRTVGLPPRLLPEILSWQAFAGIDSGPLFPRDSGSNEAMSDKMVYDAVKRITKAAGHDKLGPHAIRRTFATLLDELGVDVREIQDAMSHESVTTTERYQKSARAARRAPGQRLADIVDNADKPVGNENGNENQSAPRISELTQSEIEQFYKHVGQKLFNALPISVQLGHTSPVSTIVDYYQCGSSDDRAARLAVDFLVDFMRMARARSEAGALIRRWTGITGSTDPILMAFNREVMGAK